MAKKILLADDSITIQKVIELTFSDEDFDVITVGNGRLALERLPEVRPDIVLCDIIMPEKDGYEVCEQIKSNPASSHLPVLLLTGAFEPFDQERASRAGYDGSLAKPFEPETLIAKVKDLLARAPSRPAASAPAVAVSAAAIPTVVPFARPSAVAPPVAAVPPPSSLGTGFISDEPFPEIDEPRAEPSSPPKPAAAFATPPLAALSDEESAMISTPPDAHGSEDAASTVMFRPADVPWSAPEPMAPPSAPPSVRPEPPSPAAAVPPAPGARVLLPEPKGEPEPRARARDAGPDPACGRRAAGVRGRARRGPRLRARGLRARTGNRGRRGGDAVRARAGASSARAAAGARTGPGCRAIRSRGGARLEPRRPGERAVSSGDARCGAVVRRGIAG